MTLTADPRLTTVAARTGRPALRRPRPSAGLTIGLVLVVALLLAGLLAPVLATHSPTRQGLDALSGPSGTHLLGTDEYGRDLFARVLYGLRQDTLAAIVAVPVGAVVGTLLGLLSGAGRWTDRFTQRLFDVLLSFTALIMGVTVVAIVGIGRPAVLITIAMVNIPLFGRLTRTNVLAERERDYVVAASVVGNGPGRVLVRHVLPNLVDPLIVQFALSMSTAVFIEGSMSYIGIGIRPPAASLGSLLQGSVDFLSQNPWYAIGPIVTVTLLVLGFQLIADGLTASLLRR